MRKSRKGKNADFGCRPSIVWRKIGQQGPREVARGNALFEVVMTVTMVVVDGGPQSGCGSDGNNCGDDDSVIRCCQWVDGTKALMPVWLPVLLGRWRRGSRSQL